MSDTITAAEAVEGQVYKTAESELSYFTKLVAKGENTVKLTVFMVKTGKWREMETPLNYKIRSLNDTEKEAYAAIEAGKGIKKERVKAPADPNKPRKAAAPKFKGGISGL